MSTHTIYKETNSTVEFVKTQKAGFEGIPGALKEFSASIGYFGEITEEENRYSFKHNGETYFINSFSF